MVMSDDMSVDISDNVTADLIGSYQDMSADMSNDGSADVIGCYLDMSYDMSADITKICQLKLPRYVS